MPRRGAIHKSPDDGRIRVVCVMARNREQKGNPRRASWSSVQARFARLAEKRGRLRRPTLSLPVHPWSARMGASLHPRVRQNIAFVQGFGVCPSCLGGWTHFVRPTGTLSSHVRESRQPKEELGLLLLRPLEELLWLARTRCVAAATGRWSELSDLNFAETSSLHKAVGRAQRSNFAKGTCILRQVKLKSVPASRVKY